jgi:hypothetical protein
MTSLRRRAEPRGHSSRKENRALRVFLDINALSDLLSNDQPLPPAVLAERCRQANVELVLSFSNVAPLVGIDDSAAAVAARGEALQRFSLLYIRHAVIPENELRAAATAFGEGHEPPAVDPYADALYGDYESPHDTFDDVILKIDAERTLRFAGMRQRLLQLLTDKQGFGFSDEEQRRLRDEIHGQGEAVWDKHHFRRIVQRWLALTRIDMPEADRARFEDWLHEKASRAPAWRLFVESFRTLLADDPEAPAGTDIYDFSNLTIAPYVDAMVLPERVINFAAKAQRRLMRTEPDLDLLRHLHPTAAGALRATGVEL